MSSDLPAQWTTASITDVADLNPRGAPEAIGDDDLVSFVPMAAVGEASGHANVDRSRRWAEIKKGYTPMRDGDVIFAKITPCMENGKVALLGNMLAGCGAGSTEFFVLRPSAAVDGRYLLHFLLQSRVRRDARAVMQGAAGQLRVPASFFASLALPLPPIAEQRRIVAALEEHLSDLDAAVAGLERARANVARYRRSVYDAACRGELTEKRDADGEDSLPSGWRWATPDALRADEAYALAIGPFGSNLKVVDYTPIGVPLVFVRNIRAEQFATEAGPHVSRAKGEELRAHWVHPDDVLITKMGDPPGDACMYPSASPPGVITADCIKWSVDRSQLLPMYAVIALRSSSVRRRVIEMTRGVAQLKISLARFRELRLPVPPLEAQARIVEEVQRRLTLADQTSADMNVQIARAARLRQSILQRAFAGRLVPQDPDDEPAAELLARVLASTQPGPATPRRGGRRTTSSR